MVLSNSSAEKIRPAVARSDLDDLLARLGIDDELPDALAVGAGHEVLTELDR